MKVDFQEAITRKNYFFRVWLMNKMWLIVCLTIIGWLGSGSLNLGAEERFDLSISGGILFPENKLYREIYRDSYPLRLDAAINLYRGYGISAGVAVIGDSGQAVLVDGVTESTDYLLKLSRTSYSVSAFRQLNFSYFYLRLAVGLSVNNFRERWLEGDLVKKGTKIGAQADVIAGLRISRIISLFLQATYETIPAGPAALGSNKINLGGFETLAGLRISFRTKGI